MNKTFLYRLLLVVLLTPVLIFSIWCGAHIFSYSRDRAALKRDYSELNNIQYGLLSVDAWRENVTDIVSEKIQNFSFSPAQLDTMKLELNKILNALITQANEMINAHQTTVEGKIKKMAIKSFVKVDKIRERVPLFSETILKEVTKPSSKERLKFLATDKLKEFAAETHDSISEQMKLQKILDKYRAHDIDSFNHQMSDEIESMQESTYLYAYGMVGCLVLLVLAWLIIHNPVLYTPLFIMSVLLALVVLGIGLTAPMIEIDARIKELSFNLLGKHLSFHDQVIFYQSKSILDVVHILVSEGKADSVFVGLLILIFSVLFPVTKLICTKIYLLGSDRMKQSKFLQFFAFKSGKWSMADVMVVAIFMSYIGFKGILDSQMGSLNVKTSSLASIATNQTSLQPGFILFISYVLFGLILAVILKRITKRPARKAAGELVIEDGPVSEVVKVA
jgi:hypothetical protein